MGGYAWFKFWCDAHAHPKISGLSDGAFRLLTHVWALARRSPVPGLVYLTPGRGIPPIRLAAGAGCEHPEKGPEMLASLVDVRLIEVDAAGVITVHDFEENNRVPASKTPEGRRKQKAKERSRKPVATPVATLSPPLSPGVATGVVQLSSAMSPGEEEEEEERSKPARSPIDALRQRLHVKLACTQDFFVAAPDPKDPGRVARVQAALEKQIARLSPERAGDLCAARALEYKSKHRRYPSHLAYYLQMLEDEPGVYVDPLDAEGEYWARQGAQS